MKIEIDKYVITGTAGDFVLYEKRIKKEGKDAGSEVLVRLGYYSKLDQLNRQLCEMDIRASDCTTLQQISSRIDEIGAAFAQAVKELSCTQTN
ncbi:TPA: hypothetical protein ACIAIE_001825 [Serratia fonticola]